MNFALTGRGRQIIIAASALSMIGSGSVIVHQLFSVELSAAFSRSHETTLTRTPSGPSNAGVIPLGDFANALFTETGKADRADLAIAQDHPAAAKPAKAEPEARFVSAAMTPVDITNVAAIAPHLPYQNVNRGEKADRLSVPQMTVAKLLGEGAVDAAGVSTAMFLLSPSAGSGEQVAQEQAEPSEGPTITAALTAGKPPASSQITWPELIKLARMDGGDGEDIKSKTSIFGGLTELEFRARELRCMATAIYFEARDEPIKGQIAVGQVIMNRLRSVYYPKTICGVVFQGQWDRNACQFSFACDGKSDTPTEKKEWNTSLEIAKKVIAGEVYLSEIGDATHYHATYVNPPWKKLVKRVAKIGTHIFYKADFAPPLVASSENGKL